MKTIRGNGLLRVIHVLQTLIRFSRRQKPISCIDSIIIFVKLFLSCYYQYILNLLLLFRHWQQVKLCSIVLAIGFSLRNTWRIRTKSFKISQGVFLIHCCPTLHCQKQTSVSIHQPNVCKPTSWKTEKCTHWFLHFPDSKSWFKITQTNTTYWNILCFTQFSPAFY